MEKSRMKKKWSSAERLELAEKLDKELEDFITSRPKREKQKPISPDRWEEEFITHPFFMKDVPQPGEKLHPLYEGLQQLKYDPDENEPDDLAVSYKDDGNFYFKYGKYRMAIISYTEGLKINCSSSEINASLFNNRSAAHYFLKNYRSALLDAENALKLQSKHEKALNRAANSCYRMQKFEKAIEYFDKILDVNKENVDILELRKKCLQEAKTIERNNRKKLLEERKLEEEEKFIIEAILKKNLILEGGNDNLTLSRLEPQFPGLFNSRVSLSENGSLVWPVVLLYPEYQVMDYIQQFDDQDIFADQLDQVLAETPEWDQKKQYKLKNLSLYFENNKRENIRVDLQSTLLEALMMENHVIKCGTPKFIVLIANSDVEKSFLKSR